MPATVPEMVKMEKRAPAETMVCPFCTHRTGIKVIND
jgi:hypothetical protein